MDLNNLYSSRRAGKDKNATGIRTEFQRDFDRLIFSSPFRRLQNKTQIFPLPGSSFVHNRLTHSLEVASVGRSLGTIVGAYIAKEISDLSPDSKDFYQYNLSEVIAAACLAHDIGNPAFGHSGEKAISNYFTNNPAYHEHFEENEAQWADITNFEGNANAIRILTNQLNGRLIGGYRITYTTLATILKYPCESTAVDENYKHKKKYGFFQAEKYLIEDIANELGMKMESENPLCYSRHPFVYLLEAADDICYRIIDFEDGHRLKLITDEEIKTNFMNVITCIGLIDDDVEEIEATYKSIGDSNEQISYLRSRVINTLTHTAADVFKKNLTAILDGTFDNTLVDLIEENCNALVAIADISKKKLYNHHSVVELELAGYNVMYELLEAIIPASVKLENDRTHREKKALKLVPPQFGSFTDSESIYAKILGVLDFVSGMTDLYATELYRKIKGIEIGKHS
jgi:dGTPase